MNDRSSDRATRPRSAIGRWSALRRAGVTDVVLAPGSRIGRARARASSGRLRRAAPTACAHRRANGGLPRARPREGRAPSGCCRHHVGHRCRQPSSGRPRGDACRCAADRTVGRPPRGATRHRREPDHGSAADLRCEGHRREPRSDVRRRRRSWRTRRVRRPVRPEVRRRSTCSSPSRWRLSRCRVPLLAGSAGWRRGSSAEASLGSRRRATGGAVSPRVVFGPSSSPATTRVRPPGCWRRRGLAPVGRADLGRSERPERASGRIDCCWRAISARGSNGWSSPATRTLSRPVTQLISRLGRRGALGAVFVWCVPLTQAASRGISTSMPDVVEVPIRRTGSTSGGQRTRDCPPRSTRSPTTGRSCRFGSARSRGRGRAARRCWWSGRRSRRAILTSWPPRTNQAVDGSIVGNRGLAGIDGTISTAIGAALARHSSRSFAYMGDLTFLHDANALVIGPDEPRPDLTIVVLNDRGGAIFATLEQGAPGLASAFERVFGTPHDVSIESLCAATGDGVRTRCRRRRSAAALGRGRRGIRVIEAPTTRNGRRDLDARLRALA